MSKKQREKVEDEVRMHKQLNHDHLHPALSNLPPNAYTSYSAGYSPNSLYSPYTNGLGAAMPPSTAMGPPTPNGGYSDPMSTTSNGGGHVNGMGGASAAFAPSSAPPTHLTGTAPMSSSAYPSPQSITTHYGTTVPNIYQQPHLTHVDQLHIKTEIMHEGTSGLMVNGE